MRPTGEWVRAWVIDNVLELVDTRGLVGSTKIHFNGKVCENMSWPEVKQAAEEHRYELVLTGATVAERIDKSGLDKHIFELDFLNFLQISNTKLLSLPEELGKLVNLKTLDLHRSSIGELPASIGLLKELKLDLSGNELQQLPTTLVELNFLQILNLNCNKLTSLPSFAGLKSLIRVDLS